MQWNEMMDGMDGMMWEVGLVGLLFLLMLSLGIAALVKYLFFNPGRRKNGD